MKALAIALLLSLAAGLAGAEVNTVTRVLLPTSEAALRVGSGSSNTRSIDPGSTYWFSSYRLTDGTPYGSKLYLSFEGSFGELINQGYLLTEASLRIRAGMIEVTDGNGTYVNEPVSVDAATVDPLEGVDFVTGDALPMESLIGTSNGTGHFTFNVPESMDISGPMNFAVSVDVASHVPSPTSPEEDRRWSGYFECLDDEVPEHVNASEQNAPWLVLTFTKPAVKTTEPASWGGVKALYR